MLTIAATLLLLLLILPGIRRVLRFFAVFSPALQTRRDPILRFAVLSLARITPRALVRPCLWNKAVEITCIAARDPNQAQRFALRHGIPQVEESYALALSQPNVNAVYIPLPNGLHFEYAKQALLAGKHCLCEKPLASNAREAMALVSLARERNVVLMEASHSFYHPALARARELIPQYVGEIYSVEAKFHSRIRSRADIRFNCNGTEPKLAGGSLMDNGVYCIHAIRFITAGALTLSSRCCCTFAHATTTCFARDVDETMYAELEFEQPSTARARISTSFVAQSALDLLPVLKLCGSLGTLTMYNFLTPNLWHAIVCTNAQLLPTTIVQDYGAVAGKTTYEYQLDEFIRRVQHKQPHQQQETGGGDPIDPVKTMEIIDDIYIKAGMRPRARASSEEE